MVPADDKKMVTVGETRTITPEIPTPISTQ
jgi:hypothetical protein